MAKQFEFEESRRKIKITVEDDKGLESVDMVPLPKQHLRGLYDNHCILNQDFLKYVVGLKLNGKTLNLLMLLLANMDRKNRIYTNYIELGEILKQNANAVSNNLKILVSKNVIIKRKIRNGLDEFSINDDILNPMFAFKNKANKENVMEHKRMIENLSPYIKQTNIFGEVDYVDKNSGEIIYTDNAIGEKEKRFVEYENVDDSE